MRFTANIITSPKFYMAVLYWFESIRTPFLDVVMSLVTHLGEEMLFMAGVLVILWCVNKKWGYYLFAIGSFGMAINQLLKNIFCIARPWVQDANFTIVESARAGATGYSFPSGHTQSITGWFGGMAKLTKRKWLRAVLIGGVIVVGVSRMYLGVHTPYDVVTSWLIGTVLVFLADALFFRSNKPFLFMGMNIVCSIVLILYMEGNRSLAGVDDVIFWHAMKNAYTSLGLVAGITMVYWLDERYLHYRVEAPLWLQVVKCAGGIALMLAVRVVLKTPFSWLFNGHEFADGLRYFCMALAGGALWPFCFMRFQKNKKKEEESVIYTVKNKTPDTGKAAFVAENAVIAGNVVLEEEVSVWFQTVIRSEDGAIVIHRGSNIQDGCILHADAGNPIEIGKDVTVGHGAIIHGAIIGENSLIGMRATILDGAKIGKNCVIGAGALVTERMEIPDNSLAVGVPAKVIKNILQESAEEIRKNATHYVALSKDYLEK